MARVWSSLFLFVVCLALLDLSKAQRACTADIGLVVDHSGSIVDNRAPGAPDNWQLIKDFLKRIVNGLQVGRDATRFAAVGYGNTATLEFRLDEFYTRNELLLAVDNIVNRGGNTNTTGGLRLTRQEIFGNSAGDRDYVRDIVILLTDGVPTREVGELPREVQRLKDMGVRIIAVGVTAQVNEALLRSLVTQPDTDHYFPVTDFAGLDSILDRLVNEACRTLRPTPAPPPTVPPPAACRVRADVVFVLDNSGSISYTNYNLIKEFVSDIITDLDVDSDRMRVGLVTFSDNHQSRFELSTHKSRVGAIQAVKQLPYSRGTTNTAAALQYMHSEMFTPKNGDRRDVENIAVVLTDGGSNNKQETLEEAYLSKKKGIHIIAMGVGGWTDEVELIGIASHPYEKNKIDVRQYDALRGLRGRVRDLICNNVDECRNNPCRNGGRCVDGIDSYTCNCPRGYAGNDCERRCRSSPDVVFALDASGSIGRYNFQKEVDFVRHVIEGLSLNDGARIGLETYGTEPRVVFHLNEYKTKYDILNALTIHFTGGTTNTAEALRQMRFDMFAPTRGDRQGVDNVGVLITDGRSNEPEKTWDEAVKTRDKDISLLALGVGNNLREHELEGIASWPADKNVMKVADFDSIESVRDTLISIICNEEDDCRNNPCRNGGRCVDLRGGYRCDCAAGYTGETCQRGCGAKYDVAFILDASGSIRNERFPKVVDFVASVVQEFEISKEKTQVGVVRFSDTAKLEFLLNKYPAKQDVVQAIRQLQYMGGRTHTASALQQINDLMFKVGNGERQDADNVAIILTDGNSNINPQRTIPFAIESRVTGTHIIVIGVGTDLNMLELRGLASEPQKTNVLTVRSWRELPNLKQQIIDSICDDEDECRSNPCQNGGTCVDQLKRFFCRCSFDYTGERCERRCTRQLDVTLILDLSGSVQQVYDIILAFGKRIVYGLPVRFDRARVALVSFRDRSERNFLLNTYQSKEEILNAMAFALAGGRTNTQEAIRSMTNDIFSSNRGDRSGVNNIGIVVSDGGSNIDSHNTIPAAEEARRRGVKMYSVAVGDTPDMREINGIADDPDSEHVVRVRNAAEVDQAADQLLDLLCA